METATGVFIMAGVVVAAISLIFTAINTGRTFRSNRAQFWLDLRDHFAGHDEVHLLFRPGGDWAESGKGPQTPKEWRMVEAYMGLFEHCEDMLESHLIDSKTFHNIYRYRLHNIVNNEIVCKNKLVDEANLWRPFLALLQRMEVQFPGQSLPERRIVRGRVRLGAFILRWAWRRKQQ